MKPMTAVKKSIFLFFADLQSTFQFLSILPLGKARRFEPQSVKPLFPLVGLAIGSLLAVFDCLVTRLWPQPVAALLDVLFLVAVTGAFHLDGLGDTADGLYGGQTKDQALEIMKDSRIGSMGLVAIVSGLSLKWGGIYTLGQNRFLILCIVPALARGSVLFGFYFLQYGRSKRGTGHAFFSQKMHYKDFGWLIPPLLLSLGAGWQALWVMTLYVGFTAGMLLYYKRKMGCITGDMLGGMTEILESLLFLCIPII